MQDFEHCTPFFPPLSVLHNGQWENAPTGTASTAPNVARIFDPLAVNASHQCWSPGLIPLHPDQPYYSHKHYWRLPKTTLGGILSAAALRATFIPMANNELVKMLKVLHSFLILRKLGVDVGLSGDTGPSGEVKGEVVSGM
jgi:hypothetical protein